MRAKIVLSPLGFNGGFAGCNKGAHGVRGKVTGWSVSSARSNMRFLRSVVVESLPEYGLGFTFTVKDCPSSEEWGKIKASLVKFLDRSGCACWHHVTEWQERGVPHLHGVAFWSNPEYAVNIRLTQQWLGRTRALGTDERAQQVIPIHGVAGWFQYMSKHASRGYAHYQRMADHMPDGWEKTGRMWARSRKGWETQTEGHSVTRREFYELRRLQDRLARARALDTLKRSREGSRKWREARRSLRFLKKNRKSFGKGRSASETRGLNEWAGLATSRQLISAALLVASTKSDWEISDEKISAERVQYDPETGEILGREDQAQDVRFYKSGNFRIPMLRPSGVLGADAGTGEIV